MTKVTSTRVNIQVSTAHLAKVSGLNHSLLTENARNAAERLSKLRKKLISSKCHRLPTELKNFLQKQIISDLRQELQNL